MPNPRIAVGQHSPTAVIPIQTSVVAGVTVVVATVVLCSTERYKQLVTVFVVIKVVGFSFSIGSHPRGRSSSTSNGPPISQILTRQVALSFH